MDLLGQRLRVLGKGSYGKVHLVKIISGGLLFGQLIAEKTSEEKLAETLLVEKEILDQFNGNPHIIQCYGCSSSIDYETNVFSLFLELATGGNLLDLMEDYGGKIPEEHVKDDTVRLIRKITADVPSIAEKGDAIEQPAMNQKNEAVVRLSVKNFSRFIAENEYVMVDFYAPWCYWSGKLAQEYEAAAATLLKADGVALAKVDCTTERELAMKYEISGYPTLLWDGIVRWVRKSITSKTEKNTAEHLFTVSNSQDLNVTRKPVIDEKDEVVVRLTEKNFSSFIAENEYVMVNFYAPWLYWSRIVAPEYEAAANLLKGDGVVFAKVDVITDKELVRKYRINAYPTVLLFAGGVRKLYDHNRTRDDIVRWVRKSVAGVPIITEKDDAEHLLAADFIKVVGFYDTLEGEDSKELLVASKLRPDLKFYQTTNPEVANIFHIISETQHTVTVQLRAEEEIFLTFAGSFTGKALAYFLCGDKGEVPCIKGKFSPVVYSLSEERRGLDDS
ncbi:hypothetical protein COLO4_23670 [Corchorus olitorius]|uniref:Thioredoxin domain-containing protein n=1 Tax=Corchorus olitorius TaxID=93759 RepID=A0A1R3IFC6_9ROSI|nr:hypothetical protein COLO4_23670 [Corchorus olitorius]